MRTLVRIDAAGMVLFAVTTLWRNRQRYFTPNGRYRLLTMVSAQCWTD
jgi:hypothetical protein